MNIIAIIPMGWEWIVILIVGLLIFGRRLPSVARNLGSSYTQFRAGLKEDISQADKQIDSANASELKEAENSEKTSTEV